MSLKKLWKNKQKIAEGIKNKLFKQEHIEEIYEERMAICNTCPSKDDSGEHCYVPGTAPCCKECGCSLELLLRSLSSSCEENKWGAYLTDEEADELNNQIRDAK